MALQHCARFLPVHGPNFGGFFLAVLQRSPVQPLATYTLSPLPAWEETEYQDSGAAHCRQSINRFSSILPLPCMHVHVGA